MNRSEFEKLLKMGYTVSEALALFPEAQEEAKETPAPQPEEPKPEPKQEVKQEQKQEEKQEPKAEPSADFFSSMNASMSNIMNAIDKLTKAVQYNNRMTAGTDEDPNTKKADEFLKNLLEGRNN